MVTTCPQCTHTNPAGAKYCFFDGYSLSSVAQEGPVDPGSKPFPHPFVFPSGGQCENFNQLALGCQKDWGSARELLQSGAFDTFFGGMGRADLAMAAKEAVKFPDLDRALDQFISRLPSQAVPAPRLQIEPVDIRLDSQPVGKDGGFIVKMHNKGARLLFGSVSSDSAWLQPGEPTDAGPKLIQFTSDGQLKVAMRGQHLRAGANTLEGKLIFETNGGNAEVIVRIDVPVVPFGEGVLAGSTSPRQLAEKALKAAKDAAPLFEKGSVAEWYKKNGWSYPVPGPFASGLGAVQQFFEALGLTKPPRLQMRDQDVKLSGAPGAALRHVLQVTTTDNKVIFVHASSNESWLSTGRVQVKGATANVPIEVREVPDKPGQLLSARVIVTGNGNQRFDVPVSLKVEGVPAPVSIEAGADEPILEVAEAKNSRNGDERTKSAGKSGKTSAEPGDGGRNRGKDQANHDTVTRQKTKPIVSSVKAAPANPFADLADPDPAPASAPSKSGSSQNPFADADPDEEGIVVVRRPGGTRGGGRSSPRGEGSQKGFIHLIPSGLLFLAILGILLADIFAPVRRTDEFVGGNKGGEKKYNVEFGDEEVVSTSVEAKIEDEPEEVINKERPVNVSIKDDPEIPNVKVDIKDEMTEGPDGIKIDPRPIVNFRSNAQPTTLTSFGIVTTPVEGPGKKLTRAEDGSTNSTVVSIDGKTQQFGNAVTGRRYFRDPPKKGPAPPKRPYYSSEIWGTKPDGKGIVFFTEVLEVVPGRQPAMIDGKPRRQLDTVLVRYIMKNDDKVPHRVGLRIQVDTYIGANDGVPFTVPGLPGLVDKFIDFKDPKDVPDFIQALEKPDLQKPETIAHMTLKLGAPIEPPSRVSITQWPGNDNLNWEIPVIPIKSAEVPQGDSSVILYWPEKELKPNEKREIGFAYGLGSVSTQDPVGSLGITLGGSFEPGKSFTITAYVRNPVPDQTLTLELPPGLERIGSTDVVKLLPGAPGQTYLVTWQAKVLKTGEFPVRVKSSNGLVATKTINISKTEELVGKFNMGLEGAFNPGEVFEVVATVPEPQPKQTLTLTLPAGLQALDKPATKPVPAGKEPILRWKVMVKEPGKYQVKVASSTGTIQSKTIMIANVDPINGGKFRIKLSERSYEPGETFEVTAYVTEPVPGQELSLQLAPGLEYVDKAITKSVPAVAKGKEAELRWKAKVTEPGKYQVKVASSTGVTQSKTITISRPVPAGSGFQVKIEGSIVPGKSFQVIAKVPQPVKGQTLKLELPKGLDCPKDQLQKTVPAEANSPLSWPVKVQEPGKFPIKVVSSTGIAVRKTLTIDPPVLTPEGGGFKLDFVGAVAPGKDFRVVAKVEQPLKGQKLKLILPSSIKLLDSAAELSVPAADKSGFTTVSWNVRLEKAGSSTVRIESTTGQVKMRTISTSIFQ